MKVLRGTLTFVLGMIIGIILFVLAIGGTVVALGMAVKVGDLQSKVTDQEIISSESNLYGETILDAVKSVIDDVKGFDTLTLSTLYNHYGISVLNGVGGIDFTNKDFYSTPLKTIMNDFSVVVNSFTLRDVSSLTGNDFEEYNLPILTDNLDNNVRTALDNILGSIKGDLTVRTIKTKLIPDFNVENDLIGALQDIPFSRFGSAINAFKLCTFLTVNTDTFVPYGEVRVFVKADRYEQVSKEDLKNASYVVPDGVEKFNADAVASTEGGKEDTLIQKELRFVKKEKDGATSYVVDNSCYGEDFDADKTELTFFRHVEYEPYKAGETYPADTEFFVKSYANRVTKFDNTLPGTYELYFKGFLSLKDLYVNDGGTMVELNSKVLAPTINAYACAYKDADGNFVPATSYSVTDETIKKESKLKRTDAPTREVYFKVHDGTFKPLLQSFAYLSIAELQDMDDFVDGITIGDVVEVSESSPKILQALKDTSLNKMSDRVDELRLDEVIEINDESSLILKSFKKKGTRINGLGDAVKELKIDEVVEIDDDSPRLMQSLKKRECKIDELGDVIDTLTMAEIIDIYEYHQVETSDSLSDNKFLVWQHGADTQVGYVKYDETRHADEPVRYNYDGTEYVEVLDGKYVYTDTPTTFVKDSSGKYIKSPIAFEPVNRSLATIEAAYKYTWVKGNLDPSTPADVATFTALAESGNIYYFDDSDYLNNVTLCTYLFSQGATDSSKLDNLYYRENSALGTGNSYYQFSEPNLFVNVLGVFIPYEATNPAHYDMTVYALQTSPYVAGDESDYKYYVRYDEYKDVAVSNDGTNYTYDLGGTKLGAANKYSRQYCESVYLKCDDLTLYPIDQYFVFIDGKYVKYDAEKHEGLDTFVIVQAFLADESQVETLDTSDYTRVHVIHEKSAPVLRMMREHNINDMSSVVGDAVIDDLMDISPDNLFGTDKIKNSKISDLGSAMSGLMNEMTINKLLDWANVTTIDPKVKSAIGDATLTSFFNSLTYQNGSITVNMLELYGLE